MNNSTQYLSLDDDNKLDSAVVFFVYHTEDNLPNTVRVIAAQLKADVLKVFRDTMKFRFIQ